MHTMRIPGARTLKLMLSAYVVLLLPLLINGAPIYWPDTIAYLHGGSTALKTVVGVETRYSELERIEPKTSSDSDPEASASPEVIAEKMPGDLSASDSVSFEAVPAKQPQDVEYRISSARSPYYAVFLTGMSAALGPSGPAYVQALLAAFAIALLLRAVFPDRLPRAAVLIFVGLALSTAGHFSAVLLPDILAPLGLLAIGVLFGYWSWLPRSDRAAWLAILVFSLLSHNTHLAFAILILPLAALLTRILTPQRVLPPATSIAVAIGIGILGNVAFSTMVERQYGYRPASFPMIAASLIVDEPGRAYLERTCPQNGYVYCDHLETKATEVDQYLWSVDPEIGVYMFADRETRDRMSAEQWSFLLDTLHADFSGQFVASLNRAFRQVADNSITQFSYGDGGTLSALPEPDRSAVMDSAMFRHDFLLFETSRISQYVGWASFVGLVASLSWAMVAVLSRESTPDTRQMRLLVVLSLVAILGFMINAGLTGAASQPQGRYSARVFLLFPILFGVWLAFFWKSHKPPVAARYPLPGSMSKGDVERSRSID